VNNPTTKLPKFSIFYNNGEVVHGGGEDDELVTLQVSRKWLEAPSDGVACVVIQDSVIGRQQLDMYEYYYHFPLNSHAKGACGGSHKIGMYCRQMTDIGGLVKFGGWTDTQHLPERAEDDAE
jgi:hypothetical protein